MQPALQPAQVPAAPAAPASPALPRTAAEVAGLQARTDELRDQLRVTERQQTDIGRALRHAGAGERAELAGVASTLDARAAALRSDIASHEQLVSAARARTPITVQLGDGFVLLGPNGPSPNAVPLLLLVIVLLQVLMMFRARSRRRAVTASDALLRDTVARLARVEQSVDAIAVEVERVSEGQRFVSRLLGERQPAPALSTARPARQYATPS